MARGFNRVSCRRAPPRKKKIKEKEQSKSERKK